MRNGQRLVANVEELYYDKDQDENVILKDGDSIHVPMKPNTILVTGEVNNTGLYKFVEGRDVGDYIDRAGGLTDSSDYAVYNKPNGESRRVNFGWFSSDPEVFDGSMIFVKKLPPPKPEDDIDIAGTIKEIFALASSAATIIYIISRTN
jgi:protein involved in polysaccharide export with SLBB domain